jgi:hypothetical protein
MRAIAVLALILVGCSASRAGLIHDAGGADDGWDGGMDAGTDAGIDAGNEDGGDAGIDAGVDAGIDAGPAALHVLFIGNSYTYVNDLPGMLANIASSSGTTPAISVDSVVQGAATLQDHWDNGTAGALIAEGGWTHVVLQGQSLEPLSSLSGGNATFLYYAEQFGELVVDAGAAPAWYVTWARAPGESIYANTLDNPQEMQDELTSAYDAVARDFPSSVLACVGPAFQLALQQQPGIDLYQTDLSHPSVAGTYLAACTFYVALTGHAVPPQSSVPDGLTADEAAILQDIALIGSDCANVQLLGIGRLYDRWGYSDFYAGPTNPFDYGVAGTTISSLFMLANIGGTAMGLSAGLPMFSFDWTGGAYPGGVGMAPGNVPFCGDTLAPNDTCALSASFDGQHTSAGAISVDLSNAYTPSAYRSVLATATQRALISITEVPDFFTCQVLVPGGVPPCIVNAPTDLFTDAGDVAPLTLFMVNRGRVPTTSITAAPLDAQFAWGAGDAGSVFPGGVGTLPFDGGTYPFCGDQVLPPGAWCMIAAEFAPAIPGEFLATIDISFSDELGPVSPDATWYLQGDTPFDAGPPSLSDSGLPP